jgi:hypothetical protein
LKYCVLKVKRFDLTGGASREANRAGALSTAALYYFNEGSGYFFHDKLIAPALPTGRGLLPLRKAKHGVGSCWSEPFK